jgi:predicted peroxiredoxin
MPGKQEKIMYICTHASDNAEKAHLPFVMANAALVMDVQAMVVLQGEGVYLAQKGYIDHMVSGGGFPPLK